MIVNIIDIDIYIYNKGYSKVYVFIYIDYNCILPVTSKVRCFFL